MCHPTFITDCHGFFSLPLCGLCPDPTEAFICEHEACEFKVPIPATVSKAWPAMGWAGWLDSWLVGWLVGWKPG